MNLPNPIADMHTGTFTLAVFAWSDFLSLLLSLFLPPPLPHPLVCLPLVFLSSSRSLILSHFLILSFSLSLFIYLSACLFPVHNLNSDGIIWPDSVAPYQVAIIVLNGGVQRKDPGTFLGATCDGVCALVARFDPAMSTHTFRLHPGSLLTANGGIAYSRWRL